MKMKVKYSIIVIILFLVASAVQAQISIGGNVYGGGNAGNLGGKTTVEVYGGMVKGGVFGGARQANVAGSSFVHINGSKMSDDIIIKSVYGGNDISGTVGSSTTLPAELEKKDSLHVDNTFNAFVKTSHERTAASGERQRHIFIGTLYGGGNGDYQYTDEQGQPLKNEENLYIAKENGTDDVVATSKTPFEKPVQDKVYLELMGGTIAYVYGGGNNATVNDSVNVYINNTSEVAVWLPKNPLETLPTDDAAKTEAINNSEKNYLADTDWLATMGIAVLGKNAVRDVYHFSRVFGGNNKAEMRIQPNWHLMAGHIENLYSGGNEGRMTSSSGLLLKIDPFPNGTDAQKKLLLVNNVYGGCRKADVRPQALNAETNEYVDAEATNLANYRFPAGFSARVLVYGGDINNVYGGNDISGHVYGGNAVGVYSSIRGNIYGGGNGSYPYTDNVALKGTLQYGDYYYDAAGATGQASLVKLNQHRPDAEQVSIRVKGTDAAHPTIIGGAIYVGGNSATIRSSKSNPLVELKVGSHVIADEVYLGNNGKEMVSSKNATDVLKIYKDTDTEEYGDRFASFDLTDATQFAEYMNGAAMNVKPRVVFDKRATEGVDYVDYSTQFGSVYCGGNVGSMTYAGTDTLNFNAKIYVYNKVVGGCNDAYVPKVEGYNAAYQGGVITALTAEEKAKNPNKIVMNFNGLQIQPKRWETDDEGKKILVWNTVDGSGNVPAVTENDFGYEKDENGDDKLDGEGNTIKATSKTCDDADLTRRFDGGNIYGGCHNSGYVNGNVEINLMANLIDRDKLFDKVEEDSIGEAVYYKNEHYKILERRTGVILGQQGMDVLGKALNVFGGGKGEKTQIWGSTTINLKRGYTFQIFGGSQEGVIGQPDSSGDYEFGGNKYKYDPAYSCTINVHGTKAGESKTSKNEDGTVSVNNSEDIADCEFIYGGGFEGPICGNTTINLGNGRVFNTFAGSCNADILGHTETYIGRSGSVNASGEPVLGFPWIRDYVYGGNDLGGEIQGDDKFTSRVRDITKVHSYQAATAENPGNPEPDVLTASAYIEYVQGRAEGIFGGCYGAYDYTDDKFAKYTYTKSAPDKEGHVLGSAREGVFTKPHMDNVFVNFRPKEDLTDRKNVVNRIFGAGQGYSGEKEMDMLQERSYVLIDIPDSVRNYLGMEVFGAGSYGGLGMKNYVAPNAANSDEVSAIIDLVRGQIGPVYGASYNEGFTRRTVVNVPKGSTINVQNIFGGAFGVANNAICDAYEANVNYHSEAARVRGNIYGGNNSYRRTLYGRVNIDVPVWQKKEDGYLATVYGAGYGVDTWSQYTEVNLNNGAKVWEVYGGGQLGEVANKATAQQHAIVEGDLLTIDSKYEEVDGLDIALTKARHDGKKYNTNVIINRGAEVGNYAYGGGKGIDGVDGSGDVYGTTYIALLGGKVTKDLYAAGTIGSVLDIYGSVLDKSSEDGGVDGRFKASANAYIAGGTLRNVYGGGWKGGVGYHPGIDANPNDTINDILGDTYVTIGIRADQNKDEKIKALTYVKGSTATVADYGYYNGVPAIQRNAYSGGEGGSIYGTAHLIINNAYIGYEYVKRAGDTDSTYYEKLDDETWEDHKGENRLKDCGNVFGAGYDDKSSVDYTDVTVWGGKIRSSVHGGGEIATVGRGKMLVDENDITKRSLQAVYKFGGTKVTIYNGHIKRNVFGGGKGYNQLGFGGGNKLYTDGYTFGQTQVYIHGGEIGTAETAAEDKGGYGNVFGGGDVGYVYGPGYFITMDKEVKEPTGSPGHIFYYDKNGNLTEDCKVVVAPYLQVKEGQKLVLNDHTHDEFDYVETDDLNTLPKKNKATGKFSEGWLNLYTGANSGVEGATEDTEDRGVIIHNAVFGGGNVSSNSDQDFANATTVFGNTTATLYDVYHRDFISVGTEHIGGLYGGGNLSVVNGYRELNITNYGTDYYGLDSQINLDEYRGLSNRERAYFQLQYVCMKESVTFGDVTYKKDQKISEEEYLKLIENNSEAAVKAAFEAWGFCSIYAGRLLNTIQRADMCGVFGSRMVLQGAKDRVASVGENIDYTINRVGELSLNQQHTVRDEDTGDDVSHGNYFGIYSIVNYLGNLTSDVKFGDDCIGSDSLVVYIDAEKKVVKTVKVGDTDVKVTDLSPAQLVEYGLTKATYYSYKAANPTSVNRNKGISSNQVALASGVYLELTTEQSEVTKKKEYGYVTGVIELDLINVQTEVGGGFVYAKNEHRVPMYYPNKPNVILSEYNHLKKVGGKELRDEARTYKRYRYDEIDGDDQWDNSEWPETYTSDDDKPYVISGDDEHKYQEMPWQTSGNFIHPSKRIVDDCYPINNAFKLKSTPYSEAHYWYVKGEVYIYEQKVSAYTGSASAYPKVVNLPLTITAASHGELKLLNVKPNLYAYYAPTGGDAAATTKAKLGIETNTNASGKVVDKVFVNNESMSFGLNDVITWWDWHKLSEKERGYFVPETIVNTDSCVIDGKSYPVGTYAMTPEDYVAFKGEKHTISYINDGGDEVTFNSDGSTDEHTTEGVVVSNELADMFRSSNNISHKTGYVLTFDMDTPKVWADYYTLKDSSKATGTKKLKITKAEYEALSTADKDDYREGPTFTPQETKVYGGHNIVEDYIVTKEASDAHDATKDGAATTEPAYVVPNVVRYTLGEGAAMQTKSLNPGTAISETEWNSINESDVKSQFVPAYVCTQTIQLDEKHYLTRNKLYTEAELEAMKAEYSDLAIDIGKATTLAYICTKAGKFGGYMLTEGQNYSALEAWCSLSKDDRIGADGKDKFTYNYDALDLLCDADYLEIKKDDSGKYQTETPSETRTETAFRAPYTERVKVEYNAVYNDGTTRDLTYLKNGTTETTQTFTKDAADATLTNVEFETLRNDKKHYSKVSVKPGGDDVYIALENITYNGIPYGKGQVVDKSVYDVYTGKVEKVTFTNSGSTAVNVYYCFENYDGGSQKGTKLNADDYAALPNDQQYFTIMGCEPTETTTLYVSSESEARDVVQEKVISVVYQYTYYEEDDDHSTKLTNELHVINVRLQLESGVPTLGTLYAPPTVLPGNSVGLNAPDVHPGLYEVYTNGWQLFSNEEDARRHRNGVPFANNSDPVYWYQNQKEWVAFYSETYLGQTFSNPVKLSVANYHDLKAVMDDPNHLHVDYDPEKLDRDCKIYINDYSGGSTPQNSLDLLKDFYDLTLGNEAAKTKYGAFATPENIEGAQNLEFYLRTDIDHSGTDWTPIAAGTAAADPCFSGNLHGDGHTISGLNKSLIGKLCGNVYNLGVTGSFTSAGVADTGTGFVENCWVKSNKTTMDTGVRAVFGHPSATEPGCQQLVNSYYLDTNAYSTTDNGHGLARPMPLQAFFNGEVAYNLNGFYLAKRFYDNNTSWEGTKKTYRYLKPAADGTLPEAMTEASYPETYAYYPLKGNATGLYGYVENRFADGDFVYASGSLPTDDNIRMRQVEKNNVTTTYYVPVWPDDYIYFGQVLNYGYGGATSPDYQVQPSYVMRNSVDRLQTDDGNRVYRAPGYFGSNNMQSVYFNADAYFAKTKNEAPDTLIHKGLTAIDFSGGNGDTDGGYQAGLVTTINDETVSPARFYPPLLDDDGITNFQTNGLTQNLLVYTGVKTAAASNTGNKVGATLHDAAYLETSDHGTLMVEFKDPHEIYGHWVRQHIDESTGAVSYVAPNDHFLVDKQDFNAPIAYQFDSDKRMWYQRKPGNINKDYVTLNSGWQGLSLPFTAEWVTTNQKGEITHFYQGSATSKNDTGTKIGHEYWLREYKDISEVADDLKATAVFGYPDNDGVAATKEVGNTFLWDYYYKGSHGHKDYNTDEYQTYYETSRSYAQYPRLTHAVPYLIGFPGKTYYEFDLSGEWTATSTASTAPARLEQQTITFVSKPGASIAVSDSETRGVTHNGYTFKPTYMSEEIPAGSYLLNADGNSFEKTTTTETTVPFRPYFVNVSTGAPRRAVAERIIFDSEHSSFAIGDNDPTEDEIGEGSLLFSARRHALFVTSSLRSETDVRIVNLGGQTVAAFTIQPGETIETPVEVSGVYIVRAAKGRYTKKMTIK